MRFFDRPDIDDELIFSTIANLHEDDDRIELNALLPRVLADYANFGIVEDVIYIGDSAAQPPKQQRKKDLLFGNYDYLSRVKVAGVRAKLLTADPKGLCGFCGNIPAGTLDHWLPRKQFPQYSIFSSNLVPACHRCNNKKRERFVGASNLRIYLHPYFDVSFQNTKVVHAGVAITTGALLVSFNLKFDAWSEESWRHEVVRRHFEDLELATMYRDESLRYLDEHRSVFYAYFRRGGAAEVSRYVAWDAATARTCYGTNHWKPVLLDALASSSDFCAGGFTELGPEEPLELL